MDRIDQGMHEAERLQALYTTYSDAELEALSRGSDTLTAEAQTALAMELSRRGLEYGPASEERETGFSAGVPGMFPSSAAVVEQALEPDGEVVAGMAELHSFFDGHELSRACEALDAAGMAPAVRQRAGNAMTGSPSWFEVWVEEAEFPRAQEVLRRELGLFPLPESEDAASDVALPEGDTASVAVMDTTEEAEATARRLRDAGFAAQVRASTEDEGVAVEVPAADRERALHLLAADLGLAPSNAS